MPLGAVGSCGAHHDGDDGPTEAEYAAVQQDRDDAEARGDQLAQTNRQLKASNAKLQRQRSSLSGQVAGLTANQTAEAPVQESTSSSSVSEVHVKGASSMAVRTSRVPIGAEHWGM